MSDADVSLRRELNVFYSTPLTNFLRLTHSSRRKMMHDDSEKSQISVIGMALSADLIRQVDSLGTRQLQILQPIESSTVRFAAHLDNTECLKQP